MRITYNSINKTYRCRDGVHWFPSGATMIEAVQRALSVLIYWRNVAEKHNNKEHII